MDYIWGEPIVFLIIMTGLYFTIRLRKVFSQNLHNDTDLGFLINRCGKEARKEMTLGFLHQIPDGIGALTIYMLWIAIKKGGAGSLFWFAVFSLSFRGILGAKAALISYYFPSGGAGAAIGAGEAALRRKGRSGGAGSVFLVTVVQTALLLLAAFPFLLPEVGRAAALNRMSVSVYPLALLLLLMCGQKQRRIVELILPGMFLCFCISAFFHNIGDMTLALRIILSDAFQINNCVFRYSGMGWMNAISAGAWLSAGSYLLQACSTGSEKPLKHPAYHSVYARLRCDFTTAVDLIIGILFLCLELNGTGNELVQVGLEAFACIFCIRPLMRFLEFLCDRSRMRAAVLAGIAAAAMVVSYAVLGGFDNVLGVLPAIGLVAEIALLVADSGWYFALMEDYRDRYVWHSIPHPNISKHID